MGNLTPRFVKSPVFHKIDNVHYSKRVTTSMEVGQADGSQLYTAKCNWTDHEKQFYEAQSCVTSMEDKNS